MLAHFSIRTKVLGLVGSMVLLCAGFSFYLLGQLRQVDDGYSRLIDREVTFALKAERARGDLANMGRQFNNVLLLQNPAGLPPLVQSIAGITARVSENLEVAARLAPTAYASRLAEARAAAGRVAEVAERIYALKRSGDHAGAAALYGSEGRPVVVGTFDQLARIADDINGEVAVRSDALTGQMEGTSAVGLTLLAVLALGSLGGGLLISAFGVTRPLRQLSDRMAALAAGDTTAEVPGLRRGDELGVMAQLLARFRDSLAEAERQRSGQQAAELQRQQEKLRDTVAVAEGVERSLGDVVLGLRGAAETLANSTGGLSRITDATLQQAQSAAAGASETSANVQTVAAAAEQLAASVAEIARQVTQSNTVVGRAAEDARRTDTTVRALSEGADRIGEVVRMISDIAGQTNLLALNATIEAARAGDAGKGFAVVAGEVKALATQTATATQEIARQVGAMQAATLQAVEAIRGITSTIDEVNQISSAIAVAVEQQGSATREIARNVQQAAQGTAEMSANVQRMNDSAVNSQSGLVQVNAAARDVSRQGDTLRSELTSLVQRLRAV